MTAITPSLLETVVGGQQEAPRAPELKCGDDFHKEAAEIDKLFHDQLARVSLDNVASARYHRCLRDVKNSLESDRPKK
jgi:hypothetical protein